MKNLLSVVFALLILGAFTSNAISGDGDGIRLNERVSDNLDLGKSKFNKDYEIQKKVYEIKTNQKSPFQFYVDLQLGYGVTNANISRQSGTTGSYNTDSKGGINGGALFFVNLADLWSFSTGLDFVDKSFEVDTSSTSTAQTEEVSNRYMNIPLNINIGGMISDNVGITFNGGPYLGILLSTPENAGLGYKNFDFGLTGTLTGSYMVAPLVSVLLGTKFQYGGLNNLGSTDKVESISTTNYTIFTGLRLGWQ